MEEVDLQPGEHVIKSVRQHLFVLAFRLLPFGILWFVPAILTGAYGFFAETVPGVPTLNESTSLGQFLTGAWWLFVWMAAFLTFTRYFLTVWIITNFRIVYIQQYGLFSRQVSSFLLLRVQDVTTEIHGIVATLIGFGKLHVDTAGHDEEFAMHGIAHPQLVRDIIMDQVALLQHTTEQDRSGI